MLKNVPFCRHSALLLIFLVFFIGCNSDDPVIPDPPVGTFVINPSPDALNAPWALTGPDSFEAVANGDQTLNNLKPGDYTITWNDVPGWVTPASETQALTEDAVMTFGGVYGGQIGIVVIDPNPDSIVAPWTMEGPGGYYGTGAGDVALSNMMAGRYALSWGDVEGWDAPPSEVLTLVENQMIVFDGNYTEQTGTIVISTTPENLDAPWVLLGPHSLHESGSGDVTLSEMVIGEYWLSWGPVSGWEAPNGYAQTLVADATMTFSGEYIEIPHLPFAGTEDQVIQNFRTVYEEMNIDFMSELLHQDFVTVLQNSTIAEFPQVGATLDLTEELYITSRMFAGAPVTNVGGNLVPGVESISIPVLELLGPWETSASNDLIPNAKVGVYDLVMLLDRPGFSTLRVEGMIKFYVSGRDSLHEGSQRTFYEMVGQVDLTGDGLKAVETSSWGSIKALFW